MPRNSCRSFWQTRIPVFNPCKIPHIPSTSAFLASVGECSERAKKVDALENDLRTARDGAAETTRRIEAANENVQVSDTDLAKQKTDVARLTTKLANGNTCNSEFDRDFKSNWKDLTTAQAALQEAIKSVFAIQGAITNMTRQMDDAVRTTVETVRLHLYLIHKP